MKAAASSENEPADDPARQVLLRFRSNGRNRFEKKFIQAPGELNAWEQQRKLGEVTTITMGQSPKGANYTSNPNDHILIQGNADLTDGWLTPRVWTTEVTKKCTPKDIIFTVRAPVGDIGKTAYHAVLGRGVAAIKGNEFIYQQLQHLKNMGYWKSLSAGSTFESINSQELKNTVCCVPSRTEQYKIGELFRNFDKVIALHQRKRENGHLSSNYSLIA